MSDRFGFSTHLYHGQRLGLAQLSRIAAHGFSLVEIFATRTHFDYADARHIDEVASALDALKLTAWSLHAPICDSFRDGLWGRVFSNASADQVSRREAVEETRLAIAAARALGCRVIVVHLGVARGQHIPQGDNDAGALRRSLEPIAEACVAAGVRLALEVIPNDLSTPDALLDWLDDGLDFGDAGVCLDFGHAHLVGGASEAGEMLGGHIITTHVHDNRGREDDHLLPFDGTVDWPATLMALSKVGYTGPLIFELPDHGDSEHVLSQAVAVRDRIQAILNGLAEPFDFTWP